MTETAQRSGCLASILKIFGFKLECLSPRFEPYGLKEDFLSNAERSFHHNLMAAASDQFYVATKVRLGDIFFVKTQNLNAHEKPQSYRNQINQKHADFLLCDPKTVQPLLIIELDDSTHRTNDKTIARDQFLKEACRSAGIPLMRVRAAKGYVIAELKQQIQLHLQTLEKHPKADLQSRAPEIGVPPCPKCGSAMKLRTAGKGSRSGEKFWGCANYPHCRGVVAVTK